jgi:hypothetical protein
VDLVLGDRTKPQKIKIKKERREIEVGRSLLLVKDFN